MSIICRNDKGWVISHYDYSKKIYTNVLSHSGLINLKYNQNLFKIITPLMRDQEVQNLIKNINEKEFVLSKELKRKRSKSSFDHEIECVHRLYTELIESAVRKDIFRSEPTQNDYLNNNKESREFASKLQKDDFISNFNGGNTSLDSLITIIDNREYLIPPLCYFISCDIRNIEDKLKSKYDFILIDPPWQNKFIKRKKYTNQGYSMLKDDDIREIPIGKFLNDDGLVGVWCTNAQSHIDAIKNNFFGRWGMVYCATWFWIKVTQSGTPISPFYTNHSKKPYERIIFGHRSERTILSPEENKIIVSVPSSVHSHKPPLCDIMKSYLPDEPECLELFARYLLPGWTSVGNQVLSLQSTLYYESNS